MSYGQIRTYGKSISNLTKKEDNNMSYTLDELYHKLVTAGEDWSDKDAAASLLEETKKSIIAGLKNESGANSNIAKEDYAWEHQTTKCHIENMVKARHEANKAKVHYESIKTWIDLLRTKEATKRAEIQKGL